MSPFQLPVLVRLKDRGEMRRFNSVRDMREKPVPEQLANAIREVARIEAVPLESSVLECGDFTRAMEQVMSEVRLKWQGKSWWQRSKRHF